MGFGIDQTVANVTNGNIGFEVAASIAATINASLVENSTVPLVHPSFWSNFGKYSVMNDYLILSQNIFLIVSNFFMLPAIFLAVRFRFRGEAIVYVLTMLASSVSD